MIRETGRLFKQYNSDYPFSYTFLDDDFNKLYQSETREAGLFFYFSGIAIVISCLGLFALAAYTAQTRFREIGVRKVLGASVAGIVRLLATDFIRLVLIAIAIAIPIAWYAMNQWLWGFAYRTDIGWPVFVASGLITASIAFLTIIFQAVKAAVANPVKSLHAE